MTQTAETSDLTAASPAPATPVAAGNLAAVTADGAVWMLLMSVLTRFVNLASQFVLARLLMPADFGVLMLASFVASFAGSIGTLGIGQFLMFRQRRFDKYADTAFWLTVVLGLSNALILVLSAPVAALVYHDQRLYGMLLFSAVAAPLPAVVVVLNTMAGVTLRFKLLAYLMVVTTVTQVVVSALAAWLGAAAYSVLIGTAAANLVRLVVLWVIFRPHFRFRPRRSYRAERLLLGGTSGWIFGTAVLTTFLSQGDYATMGFFFDKTDIGYYVVAFNLAQQAVVLLSASLGNVLYPAIAKLGGDRGRQVAALMRAIRILTLVGTPVCIIMVFVMPPAVRMLSGPTFMPAVPIAQVMSVGAIALLAAAPVVSLIQAQGRFKYYFFHTGVMTLLFMGFVFVGCLTRSVLNVAIAVSVFFWVGGLLGVTLGIDGFRVRAGTFGQILRAVTLPALWSLPAAGVAAGVFALVPAGAGLGGSVLRSTLAVVVYLALGVPSLWYGLRATSEDFWLLASGVIGRFTGRRAKEFA